MVAFINSYRFGAALTPYPTAVLADSPDLYWRLGEPSGTTAEDATANNRDGTITGSPTMGATGLLTGDPDTCIDFDGSNDRVTIAGTAGGGYTTPSGSFTLEAIFNTDTTSGNGVIIGALSSSAARWMVRRDGNTVVFYTNTNGTTGWQSLTASGTISTGTKYHVVAVYDSGAATKKIYINGSLVGTATSVGAPYYSNDIATCVGAWSHGVEPFDGRIDEAAVYSTTLDATAISAHYSAS